ncbi:hypothetical protein HB901_12530 [Listeria booriae]|uniref:hypothetical protein n=1 Tax=Listeria booriae TaxID=1552123 RepID=UPI00182E278F|nr:hypothetical protein [Listeria booriae]MBC1553544.1 hypothetical protein [Listeria booriae]
MFDKYNKFISDAIPLSPWNIDNSGIMKGLYGSIDDTLCLANMYSDGCDLKNKDAVKEFSNNFSSIMLKMLVSWPLNDKDFVNFCIRDATENLLKAVYANTFYEKTVKEISRTKYRYIYSELKEFFKDESKEIIIKLGQIYGDASKHIHGYFDVRGETEVLLKKYFESKFDQYSSSLNKIYDLINCFFKTTKHIYKFAAKNLNHSQRTLLLENISDKRLAYLL